jgi:hypothetical protein
LLLTNHHKNKKLLAFDTFISDPSKGRAIFQHFTFTISRQAFLKSQFFKKQTMGNRQTTTNSSSTANEVDLTYFKYLGGIVLDEAPPAQQRLTITQAKRRMSEKAVRMLSHTKSTHNVVE